MFVQVVKTSSSSTLSKVASLLGARRNPSVPPAVTITPAGSVEILTRIHHGSIDQSSDDESTPLMSELSSPTHTHTNQAFGSPPSSDLSPASVKSTPTHEHPSSSGNGPQDYTVLSLYNSVCDEEVRMSTQLTRTVSRQNAVDNDDVTSYWDDPETTV